MKSSQVAKVVSRFSPKKKWYRHWAKRAAVSLFIRDGDDGAEVLMIRRAESEKDPWSGQMAFPGGRIDPEDDHSHAAAIRETLEEIGLDTGVHAEYAGRLSDIKARPRSKLGRKPLVITPFVFELTSPPSLILNYEVAETVWVPFSLFLDDGNRSTLEWELNGLSHTMPCYYFEERPIWGLSLMMLDELFDILQSANLGQSVN